MEDLDEPYIYELEDRYVSNEAVDLERAIDSGGAEYGDPAVSYMVIPISSGASTSAKTTFKCEIVDLTNEETEGADMTIERTGNFLYATNITSVRPSGQDPIPCFKIGDRFVLINY